jgi:hypothetical protein
MGRENDDIPADLRKERSKIGPTDAALMQALCDELIERGVYPVVSQSGAPAREMVENYGVDWHIYNLPLSCPICQADLAIGQMGRPSSAKSA